MSTPPDAAIYPETFRHNIERVLLDVLDQLPPRFAPMPSAVERQAFRILKYAFKWPPLWPATRTLLLALSEPMERAGRREVWAYKLEQGIHFSTLHDDHQATCDLLFHLGGLRMRQGRYAAADDALEAAHRQLALTGDDPYRKRRLFNRSALLALICRRWQEAERWIGEAVATAIDDVEERANTHNVLGALALQRSNPAQAVEHFQQGLQLARDGQVQHLVGRMQINLGVGYRRAGDMARAIEMYERAIDHFTTHEDVLALANAQLNLGVVYEGLGMPDLALEQFAAAEALHRRVGDPVPLATLALNMGVACFELGRLEEAESYYLQSIAHARSVDDDGLLASARVGLAMTTNARGQGAEAKEYLAEAEKSLQVLKEGYINPQLQKMVAKARLQLAGAADE